jgi:cyanophycinase
MNRCPTPNGALLIIGGAEAKNKPLAQGEDEVKERHLDILEKFLQLTTVKEPRIEIITTASSEKPEDTFGQYKEAFASICKCTVNHIHHNSREEIRMGELRERLSAAHGIFLAGGDQLKNTSVYGGTEVLSLLKERYIYENLVVAGTSAGAMALSTPMIYAGVGRDEMIAGNVKVTMGLEFMKDVCVDTHFVDRGRFVRMAQVIASNPSAIGIGIEENTAIIVKGGVNFEVIGFGVVIIIDARESFGTNVTDFNDDNLLSIRGLKVEILSRGETYVIPQTNEPHK